MIELYNLEEDPGETNNLAMTYPEVAGRLDSLLHSARTPHPVWEFNPTP